MICERFGHSGALLGHPIQVLPSMMDVCYADIFGKRFQFGFCEICLTERGDVIN